MPKLPAPAHEYGYTNRQIHEIFPGKDEYAAFVKWMQGQTMALDYQFGAIVYTRDVERFLRGLPVDD